MLLETRGSFRLAEYKGALFRGGFGRFFRDLVCVTRMPVCTGCVHLQTCPYSTIFEAPVIPEKFSVLRKYPNAPHPFVMVPPLDARTTLPANIPLSLGLTLIGNGIEHLPYFVRAFELMGESGRFGGPFRLRSISSAFHAGDVVYDGSTRRFLKLPPLWHPSNQPQQVRRMNLEFVTPLRIRTNGHYNSRPDFVDIAHALLRRIHLISAIYGGGDSDAAWLRPLLAQADSVKTVQAEFRLFEWDRMSGRQQRRVPMDGLLGSLTAEGDLANLVPFFQAGEWLNVGSGTSMGMGKYRVEYHE